MICRQCGCEMEDRIQQGQLQTNKHGQTRMTRTTHLVTCKNPNCNDQGPYLLYNQTLDIETYPQRDFAEYLKPELKKAVCE